MKAVIMSHEDGGSYCIDSTGSFHFVKGYEDVDIGTEIIIQTKKPSRLRRLLDQFYLGKPFFKNALDFFKSKRL